MIKLLLIVLVLSSFNSFAVELNSYSIQRLNSQANEDLQEDLPFKKDLKIYDNSDRPYTNDIGFQYYFSLNPDTRKQFEPIEVFFDSAKANYSIFSLEQFIDEEIAATEKLKGVEDVKRINFLYAKNLKIKYILFDTETSNTKERKPVYQASVSIRFGALIVEGDIQHSSTIDQTQRITELMNEMKAKIKTKILKLDTNAIRLDDSISFFGISF